MFFFSRNLNKLRESCVKIYGNRSVSFALKLKVAFLYQCSIYIYSIETEFYIRCQGINGCKHKYVFCYPSFCLAFLIINYYRRTGGPRGRIFLSYPFTNNEIIFAHHCFFFYFKISFQKSLNTFMLCSRFSAILATII